MFDYLLANPGLAAIAWLIVLAAFIYVWSRKVPSRDTDANAAANSVRQSLDPDHRLEELRTYTEPVEQMRKDGAL